MVDGKSEATAKRPCMTASATGSIQLSGSSSGVSVDDIDSGSNRVTRADVQMQDISGFFVQPVMQFQVYDGRHVCGATRVVLLCCSHTHIIHGFCVTLADVCRLSRFRRRQREELVDPKLGSLFAYGVNVFLSVRMHPPLCMCMAQCVQHCLADEHGAPCTGLCAGEFCAYEQLHSAWFRLRPFVAHHP